MVIAYGAVPLATGDPSGPSPSNQRLTPISPPCQLRWPKPASSPDALGGGTVLDPFAGSGTTLRVAVELGRNAIGIELNPEYADLADRLLNQTQPALFGI